MPSLGRIRENGRTIGTIFVRPDLFRGVLVCDIPGPAAAVVEQWAASVLAMRAHPLNVLAQRFPHFPSEQRQRGIDDPIKNSVVDYLQISLIIGSDLSLSTKPGSCVADCHRRASNYRQS